MDLLFLGTSGVGVTTTRNPSSILIDNSILIDCGEGCLKSLDKHHINAHSIKAIFLTHLHADHVLGLVSFLWRLAFYQNESGASKPQRSCPIYMPQGMKEQLLKILQGTFAPFGKVHFEVNIRELPVLENRSVVIKGDSQDYFVDWIKTRHEPRCYAYKFNNRIVISGDTSPFLKFGDFVSNIDLLIHEATFSDQKADLAHKLNHSTPTDAALLALTSEIKQVICTHVPNLSIDEEESFLLDAKAIFPNISVAHDGERIKIED